MMTQLNIDELRNDTIGCQRVVHFNNAGAALPPKPNVNFIMSNQRLTPITLLVTI